MRMRAGMIATVMLAAAGLGLAATSDSAAVPASGATAGVAAVSTASEVHYVRRHGRRCYRKCYREFLIGRRVCRTFC